MFVGQLDWPESDFGLHAALLRTMDLDNLNISLNLNQYNKGDQSLPVLPGAFKLSLSNLNLFLVRYLI